MHGRCAIGVFIKAGGNYHAFQTLNQQEVGVNARTAGGVRALVRSKGFLTLSVGLLEQKSLSHNIQ